MDRSERADNGKRNSDSLPVDISSASSKTIPKVFKGKYTPAAKSVPRKYIKY
jgi:hypothetical protein